MGRPRKSGGAVTDICFCSNCLAISPAGVILPIAEVQLHGLLENATNFAPLANAAPPEDHIDPLIQCLSSVSLRENTPPVQTVSLEEIIPLVQVITLEENILPAAAAPSLDDIMLVSAFMGLTLDETPTPQLFSQPVVKIGGRRRSRKGFTDKALAVLRRVGDEALRIGEYLEDMSRLGFTLDAIVGIESRLDAMDIAIYKFRRGEDPVVSLRSTVGEKIELLRERCNALRSSLPLAEETRPVEFCSGTCFFTHIISHLLTLSPGGHLSSPVARLNVIAQVAILFGAICTVFMGVSRRAGNVVMGMLRILVSSFFTTHDAVSLKDFESNGAHITEQIPKTISTVAEKFNLRGKLTFYAVCTTCNYTHKPIYRPTDKEKKCPVYPKACNNFPRPGHGVLRYASS